MATKNMWIRGLVTFPVTALLGYWLFTTGRIGKPFTPKMVVERFIEKARAGTPVAPLDGRAESLAVVDILKQSRDHSIIDFEEHSDSTFTERLASGTSCVTANIAGPSGDTRVAIRLEVRNRGWKVVELSTSERCDCPGFSDPCVMHAER